MKLINELKSLKKNIQELKKLNEDLIEKNYANNIKIKSLEQKVNLLKSGINQSVKDIEQYIKGNNANI